MRITHAIRTGLIALAALFTVSFASNAEAGEGYIEIEWLKGGWFIGISGGSGALDFGGQYYPLSIGGVSGGLIFGAAKARMTGRVINIDQPSDIEGTYVAGGAGYAAGPGRNTFLLTNTKGVTLELQGEQAGLMFNADFNGFYVKMK